MTPRTPQRIYNEIKLSLGSPEVQLSAHRMLTDSPARPALRDKTTNASLQKRVYDYPFKPICMVKSPQPATRMDIDSLDGPRTPKAGQKRKFAEVETVDSPNSDQLAAKVVALSTQSPKIQIEGTGQPDLDPANLLPSSQSLDATQASSTGSKLGLSSLLSSFHASQEGPMPLEEQFHIEEEISQRCRDRLNTTIIPQNPMPSQDTGKADQNPAGFQDSLRMSCFVDLDGPGPLVEEVDLVPIEAQPEENKSPAVAENQVPEPVSRPDSETARKTMIHQQAEMLRTRLRLAAHKVSTNQVNTPFSRLKFPNPSSPGNRSQPASPQQVEARLRYRFGSNRRLVSASPVPYLSPDLRSLRPVTRERDEKCDCQSRRESSDRIKGLGVQEQAADGLLELRRAASGS